MTVYNALSLIKNVLESCLGSEVKVFFRRETGSFVKITSLKLDYPIFVFLTGKTLGEGGSRIVQIDSENRGKLNSCYLWVRGKLSWPFPYRLPGEAKLNCRDLIRLFILDTRLLALLRKINYDLRRNIISDFQRYWGI